MKALMVTGNGRLLDGINRHVLMVAGGLQARGIEVAVCTVAAHGELAEALEAKGIKVFALGCETGHDWRLIGRFWKVMRTFRPDVVHVHMSAILASVVLKFAFPRTPLVETVHTIRGPARRVYPWGRTAKWWWLRRILPQKRRAIFVSQGLLEHAGTPPNGVVIYNPMDFAVPMVQGECLRTVLKVPAGTPVIGTACRIAREKAPAAFTRVMCAVLQERMGVHAVVMGAGLPNLEAEMRSIIAASGVGERFHLLGYRADAPTLVGDLNCFVMTSVTEGMPTALLEAVRAKVPIAFMEGKGGQVDLARLNEAEGPLAVVVPQGDEAGLAQGVLRLLAQPEAAKARAERAYEAARKRYSIELAAEALEDLYRRVIEEAKA